MNDIAAKLFRVIGNNAVQTAEDLVVALSQAVLLDQGFRLNNSNSGESAATQWSSPGLPQSLCSLYMVLPGGSTSTAELKWVSVGHAVVLLFFAPNNNESIRSVELKTSSIVSEASQFPLQAQNASELAGILRQGFLARNAWDVVAAAIRTRILAEISNNIFNEHRGDNRRDDAGAQTQQHPELLGDRLLHERSREQRPDTSVGGNDLDPFGSMREGDGGGMVVGPDHPMFRRGYAPESPSGDGPQRLPAGAVPPGARFDPISPFGDRPGPVRPSGGRGPGAGGRGFFSGEPDPDNMGPPNSSWNYYI
ncbi:hypothetical protein J3B02_002205 [Coemansia erecta]|uniref:PI31 proteasome regulator C-terminal domain-containing protein n=1 Tax=Coemansia asiatica TaxID=1052880 RepID=A0A9W7XQI3_9FUNG|nr:hypothetical protein LPJ64_001018 [Coemansia asiatica]KAJ2855369.1 hypothetical protein J3B02_002205 [Coemansia erecta]KAJ2888104.1 hypothetical protein FB639_000868 [Coemansia asiatica]